ncbi:DUF2909 family protein [Castellaniella sp.]|uniref:DUF2909 domain-containing protein n=1 Tax=Castellaniella sp. TaxID=1955812 RepID=UPI003A4C7108
MKVLIVILFLAIVASLGSALVFLMQDQGRSGRMAWARPSCCFCFCCWRMPWGGSMPPGRRLPWGRPAPGSQHHTQ